MLLIITFQSRYWSENRLEIRKVATRPKQLLGKTNMYHMSECGLTILKYCVLCFTHTSDHNCIEKAFNAS